MRLDPQSILRTRLPGVYLDNITLDLTGNSDQYLMNINFRTELVVSSLKNLSYYFNGDFNNQYKIAVLYSNRNLSTLDLGSIGNHQTYYSRLLNMVREERDVFLVSVDGLKNIIGLPTPQTNSNFHEKYRANGHRGHSVQGYSRVPDTKYTIFTLPFQVKTLTVPVSNNLSLFIIPYLSNSTNVANSGVGNSILEKPYYIGSVIAENIIRNGVTNLRRSVSVNKRGSEISNEIIDYTEAITRQSASPRKQVINNSKLQDVTVLNDIISKITPDKDTLENKITTNKNYFSPLTLSRDKRENVRGFFGLDLLSIMRNNFPHSKIFYNSSIGLVKRFLDLTHVRCSLTEEPSISSAWSRGRKRRTRIRKIQRLRIKSSISERLDDPFVLHYSFVTPPTNHSKNIYNSYRYSARFEVNFSNIYGSIDKDITSLRHVQNKILSKNNSLSDSIYDNVYSLSVLPASWHSRIVKEIVKYCKIYSLKEISLEEEKNYSIRLKNLLLSKFGRQKIATFLTQFIKMLDDIISSIEGGATKKDPLSGGYHPSSTHRTSGRRIVIRHRFNETYDMKLNPRNYGADYMDDLFSGKFASNSGPVIYDSNDLHKRVSLEESKYLLNFIDFASDVSNITTHKFDRALDLSLQKLSFLSPYSIKTGGIGISRELMHSDKLTHLTADDLIKYNYYLLKYIISSHVKDNQVSLLFAYARSIGETRGDLLKNQDFLIENLSTYFREIKNFEILESFKATLADKSETEKTKAPHDTDDTSSSKIPKTSEESDLFEEKINPSELLITVLSGEIFNDKFPFDPIEKYHIPSLLKDASYEQVSSLPNQIKVLIKYYDYIASEFGVTFHVENKIDSLMRKLIVEKLSDPSIMNLVGYIYVNFFNLKEIQTFEGYEIANNDNVLMNKPIYKKLESFDRISQGSLILCRLVDYKNLKFNIPETGNYPTYNESFFIKPTTRPGRGTLRGTAGRDTLRGTAGRDTLQGPQGGSSY